MQEEEGAHVNMHIRKKAAVPNPRPTQVASEKFFSPFQNSQEMKPSQSTHL